MTFTSKSAKDASTAVLFDPSASRFADSKDANGGLEIAMIAGTNVIVFGNDTHTKHINDEGSIATYTKAVEPFNANTDYYTKSTDSEPTYTLVEKPQADEIANYFTVSYDETKFKGDFSDPDGVSSTSDSVYIQSGTRYTRLNDYATGMVNSKEYLGTLSSTTNSLEVTFVAWFEGTDAVVKTEKLTDATTATLGFYSRTIA